MMRAIIAYVIVIGLNFHNVFVFKQGIKKTKATLKNRIAFFPKIN